MHLLENTIDVTAWSTLWRTDIALGGYFQVKSEHLEIMLFVHSLHGKGKRDSVLISGSVSSIQLACASVCKEAARILGYELRREDLKHLYANISQDQKAYASYADGYHGWKQSDQQLAFFALNRAIEIDPQLAEAYNLLGLLDLRLAKKTGAIQNLYRAMELKPREPSFRINLAYAYLDNRQEDNAQKAFVAIKQLVAPDNPEFLNLQGNMYLRQGLYDRAVSQFLRALGKNSASWEYAINLGTAYFRMGNYKSAIGEFERLTRVAPKNIRYLTVLGVAFREAGLLKESLQILEEARALDANSSILLMNLAITYEKIQWHQKACYVLDRAIEIDPSRAELYSCKGVITTKLGDTTQALVLFNRALTEDPSCPSAYTNIGAIKLLHGDYKEAQSDFKQAITYGGKRPALLINLALCCLQLNDRNKAREYLEEAVFIDPINLKTRSILAGLYREKGMLEQAVEGYKEFLEMRPDYDSARVLLSHLLVEMDFGEEAIDQMEGVINKNPGNSDYLLELSHIYRKLGWYEIAVLKYKRVLELQPQSVEANWGLGATFILITENTAKGDPEENYGKALYYIKSALAIDSTNLDAVYWAGKFYLDYKEDKKTANYYWKQFLDKNYNGIYAQEVRKRKDELK
jgi:Flp pilus assembly protein TadD